MQHQSGNNTEQKTQSHLTRNTKRLHNRDQLLSVVQGHYRCLLRQSHETYKQIIGAHPDVFIGWVGGGLTLRIYRIYHLFQKLYYDNNLISATLT